MKNAVISTLALAGLCLGCIGYAQEAPVAEVQSPEAEAVNQFAAQMFSSLAQTQQGNFVFSPAGLEAMLRLLQQGARGTTAEELSTLPLGQQGVLTAMEPQEGCALFLADSFKLSPDFKGHSVYRVPFTTNPETAAAAINDWVDVRTNGKIPFIISSQSISPLTRMVAINAIYLKEKWQNPFKTYNTQPDTIFTKSDGTVITVEMMYSRDDYRYAEGEDWQAVALYYDTEGRIGAPGCFIGILPKGNAYEFARTLTPEKFADIRESLSLTYEQDTIIRLPRFELSPGAFSLAQALQACGLNSIFTPAANFSSFSDEPIYLSDILQHCYVKVDEEGTEAAAVTTAVIMTIGIKPEPRRPKEINFNRPFIWVIGDLSTNAAPYFMGITEEP